MSARDRMHRKRDAVARRREWSRTSSRQCRELQTLYGRGGYRIGKRVTPTDVLDLLAQKFAVIREALNNGDQAEIDRVLDWLEASAAQGNLSSFEEDARCGGRVV